MFVTRKFPPSVGGMETLAESVWRSLSAVDPESRLISHGGSNRDLVWWYPVALLRLAGLLARRRVGSVLTGDALTYALVAPLAALFRVRSATMVMGLDVTFPNRLYQAVVRPWLRRAPTVIAISAATAAQAVAAGTRSDRVHVLRLGVSLPPPPDRGAAREALLAALGLGPDAVVLVTVGRLVRRKGVAWFVAEVMGRLPGEVHYVVGGEGPDRDRIEAAVRASGLAGRVHLLGRVGDDVREHLLAGGDVFVQPNIPVPGDMEGFGLVTVEAAVRGTPVVAARLEGIIDAVIDGRTGTLVEAGDASEWTAVIEGLVSDRAATAELGARYRAIAAEAFSEEGMGVAIGELMVSAGRE